MMSPITKLLRKCEIFEWIKECQNAWEDINIVMYKLLF